MRFRAVGEHALLVEVDDAGSALALATWARHAGIEATDVVPGAGTVLFDGVAADLAHVADRLGAWPGPADAPPGALVEVAVTWDGADLEWVAEQWGTGPEGAVARLCDLELVSAFCGFAPGFAYLAGLPADLAVPRLATPRPRVPAGSVALADTWCGVYPSASPGGWRLLGHTDAPLWDVDRAEPALLAPGTRVRFVSA
ncbi:carboxyltransferase domain-containing protein [Nocardioides sp. dk4132]|uniref:5-oxoprolinase subunit B family protein n=1 Tax=unclassified Nocardioides TaxID=2615069 RepID=UPI0012964AB7|nr:MULTISPECIES: allophanate hydrolase subunit 1 [unclassified Nocardioides]MQW76389.1 carboxyltransferase domain-containing protein [Nocardioides sp. dk4132]QGA07335.1 carboxyltransferase domain-containing protein [Nocardioides sp. dk884]